MTGTTAHKTLCTNCLNMNRCFYYRNTTDPVDFCEEFDCRHSKLPVTASHGLQGAETGKSDPHTPNLCMNCKQADACNWDKTGDVLYCEEYE